MPQSNSDHDLHLHDSMRPIWQENVSASVVGHLVDTVTSRSRGSIERGCFIPDPLLEVDSGGVLMIFG